MQHIISFEKLLDLQVNIYTEETVVWSQCVPYIGLSKSLLCVILSRQIWVSQCWWLRIAI